MELKARNNNLWDKTKLSSGGIFTIVVIVDARLINIRNYRGVIPITPLELITIDCVRFSCWVQIPTYLISFKI